MLPPDGEEPNGNITVETRRIGTVTLRLQKVRCGKPGCRSCPHPKNGPGYWYAYWRESGKARSKYIGVLRSAAEEFARGVSKAGGKVGGRDTRDFCSESEGAS